MTSAANAVPRPLAGWLWSEIKRFDFNTIFCPFSGRAAVPLLFKEEGRGVIAADTLKCRHAFARALIENDDTVLDPFDVDTLLEPNPDRVQLMEGLCNGYGMEPEHGAWLDNVRANIAKLDDPFKQNLALAVCFGVIRYLTSFTGEAAAVRPDDDIAGCFHFYVESLNTRVSGNGQPCEAYLGDAAALAPSVGTDAMYFYLPSPAGPERMPAVRRVMELFAQNCGEAELDRRLASRTPGLGIATDNAGQYAQHLHNFLSHTAHIPMWFIAFNDAGLVQPDELENIARRFKSNIDTVSRKVMLTGGAAVREILIIARD
jgi:hypothetical protein